MNPWAKWKPSPSMLVALLALFVALGGTAVAAKNGAFKVRSKNIVNGQVKTADLGNNSVTSAKIRNGQVRAADIGGGAVGAAALQPGAVGGGALAANSVDGSKVQDNSLTGADVDESTLALGPLDAATFDGAERCGISKRVTIGKGGSDEQVLCTIGPFTLRSLCEADPTSSMLGAILMNTDENDSFYSSDGVVAGFDEPTTEQADWDTAKQVAVMWHVEFEEGDGPSVSRAVTFNAFAPSGQSISGQASVRADSAVGGARICDLVVSAIG